MKPYDRCRPAILALVVASLGWGSASAQTPLGGELRVNSEIDSFQFAWPVACNPRGVCSFPWLGAYPPSESRVSAKVFAPDGSPLAERDILTVDRAEPGSMVALPEGFTVFMDKNFPDGHRSPVFQVFDEALAHRVI